MPTIDIYTTQVCAEELKGSLEDIRAYTAEQLSHGDRELSLDQMAARIHVPFARDAISDVEVTIHAHDDEYRVKEQDAICGRVSNYVAEKCSEAGSVSTWLVLAQTGYGEFSD